MRIPICETIDSNSYIQLLLTVYIFPTQEMKNINFLFCLTKIYLCNLHYLNLLIQHFSFNYTLNVTFFFIFLEDFRGIFKSLGFFSFSSIIFVVVIRMWLRASSSLFILTMSSFCFFCNVSMFFNLRADMCRFTCILRSVDPTCSLCYIEFLLFIK